jgi:hypothetical protein
VRPAGLIGAVGAVGIGAAVAACAPRFEVPRPSVAAPSVIPPVEPATMAIPVSIALSVLRTRIDSVFPVTDSLDRANCSAIGGLVCHQYVYRRDSLEIRMLGDRLSLFTRLRFRGRVSLPGVGGIASCGYAPDEMRRAELRFGTSLYWRSDWRLASRATQLAPKIFDPCRVTVLRVDATPAMLRLVEGQTARLKQQFDSIVPVIADFKPAADSLWRMMQRPVALDSASMIWFTMAPEGASLVALTGDGPSVSTGIVLTARPRVVVGPRPPTEGQSLPALTLVGKSSGIHVPLEIEIPFDDLSKRATALLAGEVAGQGITVGDIAVWGVGDTAIVKVNVRGRINGALYLLGRVGYDVASRSVLIGDLRFTLESTSKMSSIKATLGAARIRRALSEATGHGRLAIGAQLDRLQDQLTQQINRELAPGLTLSGDVYDARIDALYATPTAFVVRVVFDGAAQLALR